MSATKETPQPTKRVAVYTRKSSEEGLSQEFNSLDAQRQSCEAFILSQREHGWQALPDEYSDGGFSGGTTKRPAFQRLLKDIEERKVDAIVVYRLDRLSRSLSDYLHLLQMFERLGVTFASVTEQFNTTTPSGRLVLGQLILFAQFERELAGERTRDKVRATRRKGMWTGGRCVLGFDVVEKRLVVNEVEAAQVREVFRLYIELGSLVAVAQEVERRGWRNKRIETKSGKSMGGGPLHIRALHAMLRSPLYAGLLPAGDELVKGVHAAIVDEHTWAAVQEQLRANASGANKPRSRWAAQLKGLLHCARCGRPFTTTACGRKRRYLYYCCLTYKQQGAAACPGGSIPAGEVERFVVDRIRDLGRDPSILAETTAAARAELARTRPELVLDLRRIEQDVQALRAEQGRLVEGIANAGVGAGALGERLDRVTADLAHLAQRRTKAQADVTGLERQVVDEDDVRVALAHFDDVWDKLTTAERGRLFDLLIERVDYDAEAREVAITYRPEGMRLLAAGQRRQTA